ncbi:MAG TPA: elongation factor G [Desulfobacterales bacterium]|nr:elongation factor G [Desulfobacterales bacterium]
MSEKVESIRNIALVSHGGAGKTSLAEAMLFDAGVINRMGRIADGNTALDFEPEEIKRTSSISTGFHQVNWKKHAITLLDTPGDQNFFSDTKTCLQAADAAVVVIDAVDGIKVQTEQGWEFLDEFKLPRVIFINKMDRERGDFARTFAEAKQMFQPKPIILQLPIGAEAEFKGVVDLITQKAYLYGEDGKGKASEIPADLKDEVAAEREALIENIAEADDALVERYLEGESLSEEELKNALRTGTLARTFVPVLCGSSTGNIGIDLFMDFMVAAMPSPLDAAPKVGIDPGTKTEIERRPDPAAPFSALVVKTITDPYAGRLTIFRVFSGSIGADGSFYNSKKEVRERYNQLLVILGKEQKPIDGAGPGSIVAVAKLKETGTGDTLCDEGNKIVFTPVPPMSTLISYALSAKSKGDEDKVFTSLTRLLEEDSSLRIDRLAETKEIILHGIGQIHIETTIERLKRKFNVDVQLNIPKIPYRETIKKKVRVQGRHKKQTGGHGQFGDCWVQLEPQPRGKGFEYVDAIVGGSIPRQYIPAVEKGIVESAQRGVLAGFPCVDFKATVDDGSFHAVDSSEMAFKIAGSLAFKKAAEQADAVLLEPIMKVTVIAPDEFMGDIMGDLNSRRGRVLGMENAGKNQYINAYVPMSEFQTYAPDLRSMTGGRGIYTMEFSHYDEVPAHIAQKIIEAAAKAKE